MTTDKEKANYLTFEDAFEQVHNRFVLNVPAAERKRVDRLFFHLEQAWWYYDDLICDVHPEWNLPRFSSLHPFALKMFDYSPLLNAPEFTYQWTLFTIYRRSRANYGCILMNTDCSKFLLCQVWKGESYTFPSGKINPEEAGHAAAARETFEETGFDPTAQRGTTAKWSQEDPTKITWNKKLSKCDALTVKDPNGKRRTLYIVVGVPENYPFQPVTSKEVSSVAWFPIHRIPKDTFAVTSFLGPLRQWIGNNKKRSLSSPPIQGNGGTRLDAPHDTLQDETSNSKGSKWHKDLPESQEMNAMAGAALAMPEDTRCSTPEAKRRKCKTIFWVISQVTPNH
jgi:mRNA-decapping enzyme subunit 2